DREGISAHTGELEQCQAVGTEVVEQFGITHHAAHGSCASIGHEVVGGLLGLPLDGGAGNVATHGNTGDVDLVGLGQRTAVLLGNFCSTEYNVQFPLYSKISVLGDDQHPLYA